MYRLKIINKRHSLKKTAIFRNSNIKKKKIRCLFELTRLNYVLHFYNLSNINIIILTVKL